VGNFAQMGVGVQPWSGDTCSRSLPIFFSQSKKNPSKQTASNERKS